MPATCAAATVRVAPTEKFWVPAPDKVPVPEGLLVKEVASIVSDPLARVSVTVVGNVMAYVYAAVPVTVKAAADTVPVVAGRVTPDVRVRVPAGARTTVPPVAVCTEILPKLILAVLEMLIGVTMVAVAVAVAVDCAFEVLANAIKRAKAAKNLFLIFIGGLI